MLIPAGITKRSRSISERMGGNTGCLRKGGNGVHSLTRAFETKTLIGGVVVISYIANSLGRSLYCLGSFYDN